MTKIIMHGYNGKMGKVICELVKNDPNAEIVAGVDRVTSNENFPTFLDIDDCNISADVIIDFSNAIAVPKVLNYAVSNNMPIVICTTGIDDETINKINEVSKSIPIFFSYNMSLGINIMASLLKKVSSVLFENNFDIEIVEKHHNHKVDAPSGTAILLANSINNSMNNRFNYVYDRTNYCEKRDRNEIGMSAIRGGSIVGEHSVIFAGKDEVVEFSHSAYSKEVFAVGAIKAGKFMKDKSFGKYDMQSIMDEL